MFLLGFYGCRSILTDMNVVVIHALVCSDYHFSW